MSITCLPIRQPREYSRLTPLDLMAAVELWRVIYLDDDQRLLLFSLAASVLSTFCLGSLDGAATISSSSSNNRNVASRP